MRKLLWFTVGFTLSCAVGVYIVSGSISLIFAILAAAIAAGLLFVKVKPSRIIAVILLGVSFGSGWIFLYNAFYLHTAKDFDGETVISQIEIADYSYETNYGIAAEGVIELDNKEYRVIAYLSDINALSPGDVVKGSFRLHLTTGAGEQEATYHQGKGIFLLAYSEGRLATDIAAQVPAKYFAVKLRQDIISTLESVFPEDSFGFAKALLLGDSSDLTYQEDTAFRISGIRHIIAVSGLHVAILFSLIYSLSGKHRIITSLIGVPVLVLFCAVAGFTPSVVRSCIMQGLMMLAMLSKREYDPPTSLAFAVLVILMVNPMAITSISFQLSVGCIIGIFLLNKPISGYIMMKLGHATGKSFRARLTRWFAGSVSVTVGATVFTTPLSALYFGTVSIVGVLTNLLTLWVVSFIFYGIMLACALGVIWLPLGKIVAVVASVPIRYVILVAKALSSLPFASLYTCSVYTVILIIVCYVLLGAFLLMSNRRPVILAVCMVVCFVVSALASYIEPRLDDFRVSIFDVDQGQSVLIQSNGRNYLVDCGGDNDKTAADTVIAHLRSQGIYSLDGIILTHYDSDHAGGVINLLSQISAEVLYLPYILCDTDIRDDLRDLYQDDIQWVRQITTLTGDFGKLTLVPGESGQDENESGLCILFQTENCDILITGDRSTSGEQKLMESIALPQLELLVVGHHGSGSSTGYPLLSKTRPVYAAISVGEDNLHGHPAADVLSRLELFGTKILRTDLDGTIIFRGR